MAKRNDSAKLITWKPAADTPHVVSGLIAEGEEMSVVGFVIRETKEIIHVASTRGMQGYLDIVPIYKNDIVAMAELYTRD